MYCCFKRKTQREVELYTRYLGKVSVTCSYLNGDKNNCTLDCFKTFGKKKVRLIV